MLRHGDLVKAVELGRFSGRLSKLSKGARAFLYAALKYTERGNVIKSPYVLKHLNQIIEFLKSGVSEDSRTAGRGEENIKKSGGESIKHTRDAYLPPNSIELKEQLFDLLCKLRGRPDARRRVSLVTRRFLELVMRAPVKFRNQKLLYLLARALKEVKEALSPGLRLLRLGVAEAWKMSMIAYSWGNRSALEWRRDKAFITYWGAMIQNWPRAFQLPTT